MGHGRVLALPGTYRGQEGKAHAERDLVLMRHVFGNRVQIHSWVLHPSLGDDNV
jgi:hypothetical protein